MAIMPSKYPDAIKKHLMNLEGILVNTVLKVWVVLRLYNSSYKKSALIFLSVPISVEPLIRDFGMMMRC